MAWQTIVSSFTQYSALILRFEFQVAHPVLSTTFTTDQKFSFSYLLPKLSNELTKIGHKFRKNKLIPEINWSAAKVALMIAYIMRNLKFKSWKLSTQYSALISSLHLLPFPLKAIFNKTDRQKQVSWTYNDFVLWCMLHIFLHKCFARDIFLS